MNPLAAIAIVSDAERIVCLICRERTHSISLLAQLRGEEDVKNIKDIFQSMEVVGTARKVD